MPYEVIKVDEGQTVPASTENAAGLCFMGGPMSVNDDLPWIEPVLALIRDAITKNIPVIGHCLGGQLMSKAMGGMVSSNPIKEIGWGSVRSVDGAAAEWLGDTQEFEAFHWHGETFSIPTGATRILASGYCDNQAFVLGPHLSMQCHVEMTQEMIREWCEHWQQEGAAEGPSVLTPAQIFERMDARIAAMRGVSDRLYSRWITGLVR
ncbi:MAG TPA: type 1 glutamine amidotransferase [Rhodocyclaceae bacterium]|nr:type 1 glutamine amidotransferase [Rhodocyclaceae bacterium]